MSESTQAQLDALSLTVRRIQAQVTQLKADLSGGSTIQQVVRGMTIRSMAVDDQGRPLIEMNMATGEFSLRGKGFVSPSAGDAE